MAANLELELVDGWTDARGRRHRRVVLRAPTARDVLVARRAGGSPDELAARLLARLIVRLGDVPGGAVDAGIVGALGLPDRRLLARAYDELSSPSSESLDATGAGA